MQINSAFNTFLFKRLISSLVLLVVVMSMVFFANRQIGDPARMVLGNGASEEAVLKLRQQMGLEDPMVVQYGRFLAGLATGDLGQTFRFGMSNSMGQGSDVEANKTLPIALQRLPATLFLAGATILFSVAVALPMGVYAAMRPRSPADRMISVLSLAGVSIVEYWFALILILFLRSSSLGCRPLVTAPSLTLFCRRWHYPCGPSDASHRSRAALCWTKWPGPTSPQPKGAASPYVGWPPFMRLRTLPSPS